MSKEFFCVLAAVSLPVLAIPACVALSVKDDITVNGRMCINDDEKLTLAKYTTGCSGFNARYCLEAQTRLVCPYHEAVVHRTMSSWPDGEVVKVLK